MKYFSFEDKGPKLSEGRLQLVGGTPWSKPMCGCDAPGSYHWNFGNFLGVTGGWKKIAHWAWQVGKIKMFWLFEPVEESGGQMVVQKRGTNMCCLTCAAPSIPLKTLLFAYACSSLWHRPATVMDAYTLPYFSVFYMDLFCEGLVFKSLSLYMIR